MSENKTDVIFTEIPGNDGVLARNDAKPVEAAPKDKSFSTNGGVGVEARDVNATIGVDKVDNSVKVGDNSTLTINNDNSKTVNKNRFDKAIDMKTPADNTPQADAGLEK